MSENSTRYVLAAMAAREREEAGGGNQTLLDAGLVWNRNHNVQVNVTCMPAPSWLYLACFDTFMRFLVVISGSASINVIFLLHTRIHSATFRAEEGFCGNGKCLKMAVSDQHRWPHCL
jgi:hypothetical protein